jgi:hypothetical protein
MITTVPSTLDCPHIAACMARAWRSLFELHCAIVNRLQATSSLWVSS